MTFYQQNIPQASDDPKVSQAQILSNFGKANSDFNVDHVQFSAATNNGLHRRVVFQDVLSADPDIPANICSLYTKAVSMVPQLFFQNNNMAADVYQLTNLVVTNSGTKYSVTTPWGLKLHFGSSLTSPIDLSFDSFTGSLYTALLTGEAAVNPRVLTFTTTTITYTPSSSVYYLAVGSA